MASKRRGIVTRLLLLGSLAAVVAWLPQDATAQAPIFVLGASADQDTVVQLDVIASFTRGRFDSLPRGEEGDGRADALRTRLFGAGRRYWLYEGGTVRTPVTAIGAVAPACVGVSGSARPARSLPAGWSGLAASDSTLRVADTRRATTRAELARLRAAARGQFRELGAGDGSADAAQVLAAWALGAAGAADSWLFGAFRTAEDSAGERVVRAVFLGIAAAGDATAALAWSHRALEDDAWIRVPVDVLDLDHDGRAELFTRTTYSESHDFQIWRLQDRRWVLWIQTGGVGC